MDFIRRKKESFKIIVPNLTYREIYALDVLLPYYIDIATGKINEDTLKNISLPNLSSEDIINYAKVYRYFPTFAEATL